MGFLSKAWKGIKGAVKKVAKGVKKVAKGIVTALPLGQKLWKGAGKLGGKIMKGLNKLGPLGSIALSFVLPGIGAAFSSMWTTLGGTILPGMVASTNALVSAAGTAGTYIFNAANYVGSTLGALGKAVTEGASNLVKGNFSQAAQAFGANIKSAFTGEAGMTGMKQAAMEAAKSAGTLGMDAASQTKELLFSDKPFEETLKNQLNPAKELSPIDMSTDVKQWAKSVVGDSTDNMLQDIALDPMKEYGTGLDKMMYGKEAGSMTAADWDAFSNYGGADAVEKLNQTASFSSRAQQAESSAMAKKLAKGASSLLGGAGGDLSAPSRITTPSFNTTTQPQGIKAVRNIGSQGSLLARTDLRPLDEQNQRLLQMVQQGF